MTIQLRQICLVASKLSPTIHQLNEILAIKPCFVDTAVKKWGLENTLLSIGDNFLEVVAPTRDGTAAGRYLKRRRGDGGYMVICQANSHSEQLAVKGRAEASGVRIAWERQTDQYHMMQLHPADMQSAFLEVDWDHHNDFVGNWHPAGGLEWKPFVDRSRTLEITGVELQSHSPEALAEHWSKVLGVANEKCRIDLNNAFLKFVPLADDRGPGLSSLHLKALGVEKILDTAKALGCSTQENSFLACGVNFRLNSA